MPSFFSCVLWPGELFTSEVPATTSLTSSVGEPGHAVHYMYLTPTTHPCTCHKTQPRAKEDCRHGTQPAPPKSSYMSSPTSSIPAEAPQAPPTPVPDDESSDSDEGDLLEELWPRETKPLLTYQVSPACRSCSLRGVSLRISPHFPPFPSLFHQMTFSNGASVDLPIVQDLMGRRYEMGIGNIVVRVFLMVFPM